VRIVRYVKVYFFESECVKEGILSGVLEGQENAHSYSCFVGVD